MTRESLSAEFDTLYNNITSNRAPGLSEFEKSVFCTEALELIVRDAYSGNSGPFEATEEVTQYLQSLVKQQMYYNNAINQGTVISDTEPLIVEQSTNAVFNGICKEWKASLPADFWFTVFESATIADKSCPTYMTALVVPTTHNELYKRLQNPFRNPDARTVLRVTIDNTIELYSSETLKDYCLRYLSSPGQIHLIEFAAGDVPDGWGDPALDTFDNIPESLHRVILFKAVELAKAAWQ